MSLRHLGSRIRCLLSVSLPVFDSHDSVPYVSESVMVFNACQGTSQNDLAHKTVSWFHISNWSIFYLKQDNLQRCVSGLFTLHLPIKQQVHNKAFDTTPSCGILKKTIHNLLPVSTSVKWQAGGMASTAATFESKWSIILRSLLLMQFTHLKLIFCWGK